MHAVTSTTVPGMVSAISANASVARRSLASGASARRSSRHARYGVTIASVT